MLLICLQYFQASASAAPAERQGKGRKEINLLGIVIRKKNTFQKGLELKEYSG